MRRISEKKLPQKVWKWKPRAGRTRGRPKRDRNAQVNEALQKK